MAGRYFRALAARLAQTLARGRLAALLILAAVIALHVTQPPAVQLMLMRSFDLLQDLVPRPTEAQSPVVIVDLDDASLAKIGQWPWPRTIVAALVDRLSALDAAVIGFDVIFAEPDRTSPGQVAALYPDLDAKLRDALGQLPSNDEVLAASLRRSGRVVLGASASNTAPPQEAKAPLARLGADPRPFLRYFPGALAAIPTLDGAAAGRGMVTIEPEGDSIVRRIPLVFNVADQLFPALAFDMLRVLTGQSVAVRTAPDGISDLLVADNLIPTDEGGRVWVHFAPHEKALYVSAKDVLDGTVDPARIAGKLVLIGTSAIGLVDTKTTPLDAALPGIEVHAQLLETILGGTYLTRPSWAPGVERILIALTGLAMIVLVPLAGARNSLFVLIVVGAAIAAGTSFLYVRESFLIDGLVPLATSIVLYTVLVYANYMREERQRRQIRSAFSQYLSPAVVERVAANPELLKLGGEFRTMTFLFSDIRGFTAISERYRDAARSLTRLVNRFMTPMTEAIQAERGTIDKFIGDCIMAFWNAPEDDAQHPRNACRAALAMLSELAALNATLAVEAAEGEAEQQRQAEGGGAQARRYVFTKRLDIGIGINTGECIVGNMGSDLRLSYTVLGDAVNIAARLESQSKSYGVITVLGEDTARHIPDFATLELDLIAVKGRAEALHIFTLLGDEAVASTPAFQALRERHEAMLAAYRGQDWGSARALADSCRSHDSSGGLAALYDLYTARIAAFEREPPPPGWRGVHVAETK